MAKKRKRKLRIDRIIILLAILAAIIFILTKMVSCTVSLFSSDKDESSSKIADEQVYASDSSESESSQLSAFTVVIDAGHGGSDTGALDSSQTRYEKDDVLQIALLVQSQLAEYGDINVIMTRTDDTFVSLDDRCAVANDIDADLFVSIHRNSADIGNGVEIWINSENNSDDKLLAQKILSKFPGESISQSRGIKEGYRDDSGNEHNYYVNSATTMPSCLVELGFITDENDNALFDTYKSEYAKAIADGIIDAANVLELYP